MSHVTLFILDHVTLITIRHVIMIFVGGYFKLFYISQEMSSF